MTVDAAAVRQTAEERDAQGGGGQLKAKADAVARACRGAHRGRRDSARPRCARELERRMPQLQQPQPPQQLQRPQHDGNCSGGGTGGAQEQWASFPEGAFGDEPSVTAPQDGPQWARPSRRR